jgi:hypothetical protein
MGNPAVIEAGPPMSPAVFKQGGYRIRTLAFSNGKAPEPDAIEPEDSTGATAVQVSIAAGLQAQ